MTESPTGQGILYYRIVVNSLLDSKWADWFNGLTITPLENGGTCLAGPVADQAALHGILTKIRDLGLTLISVQLIENKHLV